MGVCERPALTPGATGGAVVLWVRQQVVCHLVCKLSPEVAARAVQLERAEGQRERNKVKYSQLLSHWLHTKLRNIQCVLLDTP